MKLIAVDDHPLMQQALLRALPELDRSLEVIVAEDRDSALTALARHPDCALLLLDLDAARRAWPRPPRPSWCAIIRGCPCIVLSATHDRATVGAALAAGARGYVAKTASPHDLLDAVRTVLAGGQKRHAALRPRAGARRRHPRRGARPHAAPGATCCSSSCRASRTSSSAATCGCRKER